MKYRRVIRKEGTGMYTSEVLDERGIPRSTLPIEQRWSARYFELEKVFRELDLEDATLLEPSWYYNPLIFLLLVQDDVVLLLLLH